MSREVCGDEEDFVRGITSAQFDDGELSSEFFSGKAVSVSRLCVANERDSVALLKEILEWCDVTLECGSLYWFPYEGT